jgi:hypothetical protein
MGSRRGLYEYDMHYEIPEWMGQLWWWNAIAVI